MIRGPYLFYDVVYALEVMHADGSVIRYGEIAAYPQLADLAETINRLTGTIPVTLNAGAVVKEGQVVAYVGKMQSVAASMLHFELYRGKWKSAAAVGKAAVEIPRTGPLTDRSRPPYMRRIDLIDPTAFLDRCTMHGVT